MSKGLTIGIPLEKAAGEKRVSMVPQDVGKLVKAGYSLLVEKNAGNNAGYSNTDYETAGAKIASLQQVWKAQLVLHVQPPATGEVSKLAKNSTLISHIYSSQNSAVVKQLAKAGVNTFAMELLPRITRAQAMDSLSSQATVSGYWSVLHAASIAPVFFPMLTYAAGTIKPARVLVIGAGVAGLQAIATARRLGAIVEAFDVRPETKEQISSLGAKPVDLGFDASGEGGYARELTKEERNQVAEVLTRHVSRADIVITTAGVPGKPPPKIISRSQVEGMQPGSLIVDTLAENGGNCDLTKPGKVIQHKGVTISGPVNIPSNLSHHASEMYSRNLTGFLGVLLKNHKVDVNSEDEMIKGSLLTTGGEVCHEQVREALSIKKVDKKPATVKKSSGQKSKTVLKPKEARLPTKASNAKASSAAKTTAKKTDKTVAVKKAPKAAKAKKTAAATSKASKTRAASKSTTKSTTTKKAGAKSKSVASNKKTTKTKDAKSAAKDSVVSSKPTSKAKVKKIAEKAKATSKNSKVRPVMKPVSS